MKTRFNEEHYARRYDELMKRYNYFGSNLNLEELLGYRTNVFQTPAFLALPENERKNAIAKLTKYFAQEIADKRREELVKEMAVVKRVKEGKSSLGGRTRAERIHREFELDESFEFGCYVLKVFKQKYGLD